jgi:DNA-binding NtrC family response regulator
MTPINLVVYQKDPGAAQALVVCLSEHFGAVRLAHRYEDIRVAIVRNHANVLVLDLEEARPDEIARLHREFPALCIVGTHRLADEQRWAEALTQGAADLCEPRHDLVVRSVLKPRTTRLREGLCLR